MGRVQRRLAAVALALVVAACGTRIAAAGDDSARVPTDEAGRALLTADGRRLNHAPTDGRLELSDAALRSAQRAGTQLILGQREPGVPDAGRPRPDGGGAITWPGDEFELPRPDVVNPALMRQDHVIGSYNQGLGTKGIHAVDVDGDGIREIVCAHGALWYVVRFDPETRGYVQQHFHEVDTGVTFGGGTIAEVQVGNVDADPALEIVVLRTNGDAQVHDAASGALEVTQALGVAGALRLELADIVAGGAQELIVLGSAQLAVFQLGTLPAVWTYAVMQGVDLAVGNLDGDAALEIVIARGTGTEGRVLDAGTRALEWAFPLGFGSFVSVGNVDDDATGEIACANTWGDIFVVDGVLQARSWTLDNFNTSALRVVDSDGDTVGELLVGDAQWGDVTLRDGRDGSALASIPNPEHSVAWVDLADVDGDCDAEVIWGAGYSSTGSDRLYVGALSPRAIEWENIENDGPMHSFVVADVDADGQVEVLRACSESDAGYDGALVFVTDLHHFRDEWLPPAATNDGWMVTQGMVVGQFDGDPQLEYVLNDSRTYSGKVSCFDASTHARQWTSGIYDGEYVSALALGDPDRDMVPDVVVGTGKVHTGAMGTYLRQYDARDGSLIWQSPSLSGAFTDVLDIRMADVDGDGTTEILAVNGAFGLFSYDGVTHVEEWTLPITGATCLDTADVNGDTVPDVLVGDSSGRLTAWDGSLRMQLWQSVVGTGSVHAVRVADVDGDGATEFVVSADQGTRPAVSIRALSDRSEIWRSPSLTGRAGAASSLYVLDADDDDLLEVAVSTSSSVTFFEYADGAADVQPPGFAGGAPPVVVTRVNAQCCPSVDVSWGLADDDASPPVRYQVHRGTTAGFVPSAATLLGTTGLRSFRDATTAPDTDYWYAVRAVDRAGNLDSLTADTMIRTLSVADPGQATMVAAVDVDVCAPSGVRVSFTHPGLPSVVRHALLRDGGVVAADVTSPVTHVPPDALSHSYAILTSLRDCPLSALSASADAADLGAGVVAPTLVSVVDEDDCTQGAVRLTFTHAGFPGNGHLELWIDGGRVTTPVTSPHVHVTTDANFHGYVIRAADDDCPGGAADSNTVGFADVARVPAPATITSLTLSSDCAPGTIRLEFTHPGFPGAGHFELWRDGGLMLSPVTSGATFAALDTASHAYVVRAVDEDCSVSADSAPLDFAALPRTAVAPAALVVVDPDPCAAGTLQVTFTHPGFGTGLGHFELWRDATLFLSPVVSGATFAPGDQLVHSWSVRAVDETCATTADSALLTATDRSDCGAEEADIRVARGTPGKITLSWSAVPGAAFLDAYVGTLDSLWTGRAYDHAKSSAGVTFPSSPTPADGCDAADGPQLSADVAGLPAGGAFYFLVVPVDATGRAESYGQDSAGRERHDPAVDPRGPAFFCR